MDANEFWCRAFLAAMHGCYSSESSGSRHAAAAEYCGKAAKAALEEAERWGMFKSERKTDAAPELVRVEFTAERAAHGQWDITAPPFGPIRVRSEQESATFGGLRGRVKWNESMPPKPIEVWIERPARSAP